MTKMKFKIEKDPIATFETTLKARKLINEDVQVVNNKVSKKIGNFEIADKLDEIGIVILPKEWDDEDDDYPTYTRDEILDILEREGTNA